MNISDENLILIEELFKNNNYPFLNENNIKEKDNNDFSNEISEIKNYDEIQISFNLKEKKIKLSNEKIINFTVELEIEEYEENKIKKNTSSKKISNYDFLLEGFDIINNRYIYKANLKKKNYYGYLNIHKLENYNDYKTNQLLYNIYYMNYLKDISFSPSNHDFYLFKKSLWSIAYRLPLEYIIETFDCEHYKSLQSILLCNLNEEQLNELLNELIIFLLDIHKKQCFFWEININFIFLTKNKFILFDFSQLFYENDKKNINNKNNLIKSFTKYLPDCNVNLINLDFFELSIELHKFSKLKYYEFIKKNNLLNQIFYEFKSQTEIQIENNKSIFNNFIENIKIDEFIEDKKKNNFVELNFLEISKIYSIFKQTENFLKSIEYSKLNAKSISDLLSLCESDIILSDFFFEIKKYDKCIELSNQTEKLIDKYEISIRFKSELNLLKAYSLIQKENFTEAKLVLELGIEYLLYYYQTNSLILFPFYFALTFVYRELGMFNMEPKYSYELKEFLSIVYIKKHPFSLNLSEKLAFLFIALKRYLEAMPLLELTISDLESRSDKLESSQKYVNLLNGLGVCYFHLHEPQKALQYYEKSIKITSNAFQQDPELQANSLNNLSILYAELGETSKAITLNQDAINIYRKNNESENLANGLNNLGLRYKSQGKLDEALKSMQESLKIFTEKNGEINLFVGKTLNNIAMTFFDKKEFELAAENCLKSLNIYEKIPHTSIFQSNVLNNLGLIYFQSNNFDKSIEFYQLSLKIKYSHHCDYKSKIETLQNLAEAFLKIKNINEAIENLKIIIGFYNGGFVAIDCIEDSAIILGNCYYSQKKYNEAVKMYEIGIKERISKEEYSVNLSNIVDIIIFCLNEIGQKETANEFIQLNKKITLNFK